MRVNSPLIWELWNEGGPFIGENRSHAIVTVEKDWWLYENVRHFFKTHGRRKEGPTVGDGMEAPLGSAVRTWKGMTWWDEAGTGYGPDSNLPPIRWFQREANTQVEDIIPNVTQIAIDRSVDQDAATCTITINNQKMHSNIPDEDGEQPMPGQLGMPGYYTANRGEQPLQNKRKPMPGETNPRAEKNALWGHKSNEWRGVLVPNALIRTYQGYGGHNKTLEQAEQDGNLVRTGCWLIDKVTVNTNGDLTVECRDMAKLLIEQQMYPPFVPSDRYPIEYYRWKWVKKKVPTFVRNEPVFQRRRAKFLQSCNDLWYPGSVVSGKGMNLHGHWGSDALDGKQDTFWLSVGNSHPSRPFATDWIEFSCGDEVSAVGVSPWGGPYTCYVSVMVNGQWQGSQTVPYDPSPLYGRQPHVVDTGANIPYVSKSSVGKDGLTYIGFKRCKPEKIRVTFRDHKYTQWGQWHYRVGVREVFPVLQTGVKPQYKYVEKIVKIPGNYRDYCLDDQSEALTKRGWLKWDEIVEGDQVLGVDPDTDESCWQNVNFVYRKHRARKMVEMKGASFDALTTPDHRWLVKKGESGKWKWTTSDAMIAADRIPLSLPGGHTPLQKTFSDEFVELAAWFWTEGNWSRLQGSFSQSETANPQKVARIRETLTRGWGEPGNMKVPLVDRPQWNVYPHSTPGVLIFSLGSGIRSELRKWLDDDKAVSWDFLNALTQEQLDLFIDVSVSGDGWFRRRDRGRPEFGFSQHHEGRSKAFEYACLLAGRPVITHKRRVEGKDCWVSTLLAQDYMSPVRSAAQKGRATVKEVDYEGVVWCPSVEHGNFVARRNGSVYLTGNTDIIRELLLWSGWWLFPVEGYVPRGKKPKVFGNLESTGAWAEEPLPRDLFDKKPIIDALNAIKEIVNYNFWIDEDGAARFEAPNFYKPGNFDIGGERVPLVPEINEMHNLISYGTTTSDAPLRSEIIVATADPEENYKSTVTTRYKPPSMDILRGMVKPAMWVNGQFTSKNEQKVMTELIGLRIFFAQRQATAEAIANPCLSINDQVRMVERVTSDSYIHYVRGMSTNHDLLTGQYTMTLTTHWMGNKENWAIQPPKDGIFQQRYYIVQQGDNWWIIRKKLKQRYGTEWTENWLKWVNQKQLHETGGALYPGMVLAV